MSGVRDYSEISQISLRKVGMAELRGIGHFTIWYLVGFAVFLFIKQTPKKLTDGLSFRALYPPFLPLILGLAGALPYALLVAGVVESQDELNGDFYWFLLYGMLDGIKLIRTIFGNFEMDVLMVFATYLYTIRYFIGLIKKLRTFNA